MDPTVALVVLGGAFLFLLMGTGGRFAERLAARMFQFVVWLFVKIPVQGITRFLKLCLAWLHMMIRMWLGIFMAGFIVLIVAQTLIKLGFSWSPGVALLICLFWLVAFINGIRVSIEYFSLRRVRQSQAFREIHQMSQEGAKHAKEARDAAVSTAASKTKGTPAGKLFRQNKDAAAAEQEQERLGAERAEAERIATAEQAVQDQQAAAERERRLEDLAALEPSPYDD